ncbi:MAG: bifunctional UDP-N-acetylmuramoyl-tripeptide:D-alanyl-D-alanine ligase/alanine racemase [Bacteroidetes bacterium]|nr:bifunctional UDP-N-acetylmuramoyl-tripeptide:D-alanyl-D-alanine ligase/alanine racemase [Fibrella sp.]
MTTQIAPTIAPNWLTDSRQTIGDPANTVFFALTGEHHDGHTFIDELYRKGVRQFVVERAWLATIEPADQYAGATFFDVASPLQTIQQLATTHRQRFSIPVIGITGSNGKTIVKEWLAHLLVSDYNVVKSPKSYNSQLGVPLSVHQLNEYHTLGIFEAGISKPQEMSALQAIIQPTIGIFTNIGPAHDEGFKTHRQKVAEKLRLFTRADTLIYCADYADIDDEVNLLLRAINPGIRLITWSTQAGKAVYRATLRGNVLTLDAEHGRWSLTLPFAEPTSIQAAVAENLTHCLVALLTLGITDPTTLQNRLSRLRPVSMRLELKQGIHNCVVVDDSYNNDVAGLQLALNFLTQQTHQTRKTVVLSDVLQSGQDETELYRTIARLIREQAITEFIGIGPVISRHADLFAPGSRFFDSTDQFLSEPLPDTFRDAAILVKGARPFAFERIVNRLQRKVHGTVLDINLDALTHNLNYYREKVGSSTKIMVMVKAFAYGSGSAEVAQLLQFHRVDYLAVAYADEGVSLRQHGITLPIMVMNPAPETFATLLEYTLEPEIYSLRLLHEWGNFIGSAARKSTESLESATLVRYPDIHLKLDTGMHRLGFIEPELPVVISYLRAQSNLTVATVFSHLVGADEAQFNDFSRHQFAQFKRGTDLLETGLGYRPTRHLLNSAGVVRFPEFKLDMVRIGIGLYGVESSRLEPGRVRPVGTLKTTISQLKTIPAGESVGYSRRGVLAHEAHIATLAIGYADGYDRRLGNGAGVVWINGVLCPTVGNICMDMTMVDVTDACCDEGDTVIIFGDDLPISEVAARMGTIPYEILTGVSERVKRVFFTE